MSRSVTLPREATRRWSMRSLSRLKRLNSLTSRLCKSFFPLRLFRGLKREARKRKWVRRLNYVNDKGQALCKLSSIDQSLGWVAIAAFVIYKTNFFRELWESPHRVMFFFQLSMLALGINMCIMGYLTLYLPYVNNRNGNDIDFEKEHPKLIPVIAVLGFACFFR